MIYLVDVKGEFLHENVPENKNKKAWIRLPKLEGIESENGKIVQLVKSFYGLHQAPNFGKNISQNNFRDRVSSFEMLGLFILFTTIES